MIIKFDKKLKHYLKTILVDRWVSSEAESLQMVPIEYSRTSFPSLSKAGPLLTWPMFK